MLTTFDNLPQSLVTLLAQLTQKIAPAINPDNILCYGYRTSIYEDWSSFTDKITYEGITKATFDLLVITNKSHNLADHEIIPKIELLAAPLECEVTAIVQTLEAVNDLITKNSRFLTTIYLFKFLSLPKWKLELQDLLEYALVKTSLSEAGVKKKYAIHIFSPFKIS
jgi:uncharacterized protein